MVNGQVEVEVEALGYVLKIYPMYIRIHCDRHFCFDHTWINIPYMDWLIQYTINAWPLCFTELT